MRVAIEPATSLLVDFLDGSLDSRLSLSSLPVGDALGPAASLLSDRQSTLPSIFV